MQRILRLFQTLSHFIFGSFVLLERVGEILIHPANMSRFPSLDETQNTTPESHKSLREKCSRPETTARRLGPQGIIILYGQNKLFHLARVGYTFSSRWALARGNFFIQGLKLSCGIFVFSIVLGLSVY